MTFCVAMKISDGIVGLADTRITTGSEVITASKVTIHMARRSALFIMTSGLRSVRDKALTYFEEVLENEGEQFDKLYKAVNAFAAQLRRVAREDKEALQEGGMYFDLHSIVGGQLENDKEHKLFLLYPQANWVEISRGTPYVVIGESSYGKPLIDRALRYETSMEDALKIGYLAFDATRASAANVNFPLDVVLYKRDYYKIAGHRYEMQDTLHISDWWQNNIRQAVADLPSDWVGAAMGKLKSMK